jgi:TonB-linked SusC/RagA family outer membrane protein
MKRILLSCFMLALMLLTVAVSAQERTVSGKVTGADDGLPLPQVTVLLKGTTIGVPTEVDGSYRLSVPSAGGTLVFRFLGYVTQEIVIGNQTIINVPMQPDVTSLGEVVVTGYGVEVKRDITGSIGQVKAEDIANLPLQSFDRAIQGRIAGVQIQSQSGQPGGALSFNIRGQSSLANNTPLYIIDGVQAISGSIAGQASNNALAALNSDDIASIEVLKDASAAAIYGAQAANGVVIITTKRGKANQSELSVTFSGGYTTPQNLYDMMDAQELATIKEAAFVNSGRPASASHALYGNPNEPSTLNNFDWADALFRTGSMYSANARLSGGDEKTQFYMSVSTDMQEAFIIQSDWERQTLRLNVTHQASDKVKVTTSVGVSRQTQFGAISNGNFVNGPFQAAFTSQPNSPALDENGNYNPYPVAAPGSHLFGYNILQGVNEERRENDGGQVQGTLNIQYKISDAFTFTALGGIDWAATKSINERPATIPVFAATGGQVSNTNQKNLNYNASGALNFNKVYGDHTVSGLVGGEIFKSLSSFESVTGRGFSNQALRLLSQATTYFGSPSGSESYFTRAGAFMKGSYNYKSKYYFTGTVRRDGSSRFGAQNRVGTFYSLGASWRLIEESFMSNQGLFNDLKLRVSYGVLGNSNGLGDFEAVPSFSASRQYLGTAGQVLNLANDQITWERSKQTNIGVDYAILNNRISGAIDFFRNDTGDQLFNTPLPIESGFSSIRGNVGEVRSEGIELEIQSVNVDAGDFRWSSSFNITFQNNEVLSLPGGVDTLGVNSLIVGQPINYFWGVNYAGINPANGREVYYDRQGNITYGNLGAVDGYIIGSPIADYYGGLTNTVSYKNLSLDFLIQFQGGNEAINGDLFNLDRQGNAENNQLKRNLNYWTQPGDVTATGRPFQGGVIDGINSATPGGGNNTARYMSDASYARLKTVTLTYNLPKSIISKMGMSNVSVYVTAVNLLEGIDPEVVANNNDQGGSSFGVFPVGKQYNAGISIKF